MADDDIRQTARPTGGPNAAALGKAQNKYKTFDRAASTEYERLFAIDTNRENSLQLNILLSMQSFFICVTFEKVFILNQMLLVECFHISYC